MLHENIMKEYSQMLEVSKLNINAIGYYGLVKRRGRIGIELKLINGISVEYKMANGTASLKFFGIKMSDELKLILSRSVNPNIYPELKIFIMLSR